MSLRLVRVAEEVCADADARETVLNVRKEMIAAAANGVMHARHPFKAFAHLEQVRKEFNGVFSQNQYQ